MAVRIDDVDRKILAEMQRDASQSLDEIAKAVGSSKTPVWNRIRKLKEAGVIGQQTVFLDAEALGFEACFFVLIRTSEHEADWQAKFLKALRDACGAKLGLPAASWMLEIGAFFMRTETELLLKSRRVVPGTLLESGFEFNHPTWPEAAQAIEAKR